MYGPARVVLVVRSAKKCPPMKSMIKPAAIGIAQPAYPPPRS
jgi:hypothetical protein